MLQIRHRCREDVLEKHKTKLLKNIKRRNLIKNRNIIYIRETKPTKAQREEITKFKKRIYLLGVVMPTD